MDLRPSNLTKMAIVIRSVFQKGLFRNFCNPFFQNFWQATNFSDFQIALTWTSDAWATILIAMTHFTSKIVPKPVTFVKVNWRKFKPDRRQDHLRIVYQSRQLTYPQLDLIVASHQTWFSYQTLYRELLPQLRLAKQCVKIHQHAKYLNWSLINAWKLIRT